ncbi:MAG: SET domain-containing protein [Phototrophicaceae bacterium]
MTHKVYVGESAINGHGVFAQVAFAAGDHVLAIDDSRVVDDEHPLRPELDEHEHHCDYLSDGRVVLMPLPERQINHSCDPNTYVRTLDGTRIVIARRAIQPHEEITYDYAINGEGGVPWDCHCGSSRCRGAETWADYFKLPRDLQIEYYPLLDDWFRQQYAARIAAANAGACSRAAVDPC